MKKRTLLLTMLALALTLAPVFATQDSGPPGSIKQILQGSAMVDFGLVVAPENVITANTERAAIGTMPAQTIAIEASQHSILSSGPPDKLVYLSESDKTYLVSMFPAVIRGKPTTITIAYDPRARLHSLARDQTAETAWGLL